MISLAGVSKRYGERAVLSNVTFELPDGEVMALVGGSGSGKTTTLKTINRLIEPTEGSIRIEGRDVRELAAPELRRSIGYVFQEANLFPHMTVAENVGITLRLCGRHKGAIARRVDELLPLVELDAERFRHRSPAELSGGERQRVALARALAADPKVLLLDEPFGALDAITRGRLHDLFRRLRDARPLTAVLVTHDMSEALALATRIGVMREGRLVQLGTPTALVEQPVDDYVRALIASARKSAD